MKLQLRVMTHVEEMAHDKFNIVTIVTASLQLKAMAHVKVMARVKVKAYVKVRAQVKVAALLM